MSKLIFIKILSIAINVFIFLTMVLAINYLSPGFISYKITDFFLWAASLPIAISLTISGRSILGMLKLKNLNQHIFSKVCSLIYIFIGFYIFFRLNIISFILNIIAFFTQLLFLKACLPEKPPNSGNGIFEIAVAGLIAFALFSALYWLNFS